ncbi:MAG: hypothetical protein WAV31_03885 [Candidatus Moraniibacteriota bacterium]
MQTINLEGKVCGYSKRMLAVIILLIFVSGIMFYAGAKYEKRKLLSLGFAKCETTAKSEKKAKNKKQSLEATPTTSTTPINEDSATKITPSTSPTAESKSL